MFRRLLRTTRRRREPAGFPLAGGRGGRDDGPQRDGLGRLGPAAGPRRRACPLEKVAAATLAPAGLPLRRSYRRPDAPRRHRHGQHRDRLRRPVHQLATVQHAQGRICAADVPGQGRRRGAALADGRRAELAAGQADRDDRRISDRHAALSRRRVCPCRLELSAFTPFAPLDTRFSSQPLVVLIFRVAESGGRKCGKSRWRR